MTELYSFIFFFLLSPLIAKRTDLMPVTVALDFLTAVAVGGAFTAYVLLSGATLAPYMFAALGASYLLTYLVTRRSSERSDKKQKNRPKE